MRKSINLKSNNKGSGIVTVLIAVVFLVLMASLLLMLTYTSFEIKATDRKGKQATYNASMAMDEIKLGVEKAVSDAFTASYSASLNKYGRQGSAIQGDFSTDFVDKFKSWEDENGDQLIIEDDKYNLTALRTMVKECRDGEVTVSSENSERIVYEKDEENKVKKVTLKGINVKYTEGGYSSEVSTDINITVPDIGYALSKLSVIGQQTFSGLPNFAVVSGGTLKQQGSNTVEINGGVYSDGIELGAGTSQLTFENGTLICNGDITVTGTGGSSLRFKAKEDSTVWAKNVVMKNNASIELLGSTFISNDLDFSGRNSKAKISGKYIGFGSDLTDATKSSAILVNGKNAELDISELNELTLSGISFIGEENNRLNGTPVPMNVPMGESMASKSDQRVYLVPNEFLTYYADDMNGASNNPDILSGDDEITKDETGKYLITKSGKTYEIRLNTVSPVWNVGGRDLSLGDYSASIQPICTQVGGQLIVHYFLRFGENGVRSATENANEYFKAFAMANPGKIKEYINDYLTISNSNVSTRTVGNAFIGAGSGNITLRDYMSNNGAIAAGVKSESANYKKLYENACRTLSYDIIGENGENPFTHYIDATGDNSAVKQKMPDGQKYFTDDDGKIVAVVVDNENGSEYVFDGTGDQENLRLIIATGKVTVKHDFDGLIMCGKDLVIENDAKIKADSTEVEKAYMAITDKMTEDEPDSERIVGYYFKTKISRENDMFSDGTESGSSVLALISYSNWKKK